MNESGTEATRDKRSELLRSNQFTTGEKKYLEFMWRMTGRFYTSLWHTIQRADGHNLSLLRRSFPDEVEAYLSWTRGDLAERVEKFAGLSVSWKQGK